MMIFDILRALQREILLNKYKVVFCFGFITLSIAVLAVYMPKTYESSSTIFADQQNIIKPLLEGKAAVNVKINRTRIVREIIYTRRIMEKVVQKAGLVEATDSVDEIERKINDLRAATKILGVGQNHIKVSYRSSDASQTYKVISTIVDIFLKDSADRKRKESRDAYTFIDKQVKSYKEQLRQAEERLRMFNSTNFDGSEASVDSRIDNYRLKIEEIKLDIQGYTTRKQSIEKQLSGENEFVTFERQNDATRNQLETLEARLDGLLLAYTENHPDVVSLKLQIEDLKKKLKRESKEKTSSTEDISLNPLYQELRSELANTEANIQTSRSRLLAIQKLLDQEYERRQRIAAKRAELAELTRDYDVTRSIYEDMLERKEKARLSMTLDVEGQGVNYEIQEPAIYPLKPSGIQFWQLAAVAPFFGMMVPLGLLVAYVLVDKKIRFEQALKEELELDIIAVIPHMHTPLTRRLLRSDMLLLGGVVLLILLAYAGVFYLKLSGFIG